MREETAESTKDSQTGAVPRRPGVLVVFSGSSSMHVPLALERGALVLGRDSGPGALLPDDRLSRRHAEVRFIPGEGWAVRDFESRDGTYVDGVRLQGVVRGLTPRVIRAADTLLVLCDDVERARAPSRDGAVISQRLQHALDAVERAAASSPTALIRGESGTGKELAARIFHTRGPLARGPFVAVNCAAIPEGLAERLLFGAKRGAYSGADTDATGHLQAAHGGVLFLDEGGELDLAVQAKLLRVLETREVTPLGASRGQIVDLRVCVATHRDLRAAVAAGRFRADLYHRIAPPEIVLPPLRDRLDEIPWHVSAEIATVDGAPAPHAKLVEACLLRHWPGNVRELRKELHHAATRARVEGADRVRLEHIPETAGRPFGPAHSAPAHPAPARATPASTGARSEPRGTEQPAGPRRYVRRSRTLTREQIEQALSDQGGSIVLTARALGMPRTQMYRELARHGIKRPTPL